MPTVSSPSGTPAGRSTRESIGSAAPSYEADMVGMACPSGRRMRCVNGWWLQRIVVIPFGDVVGASDPWSVYQWQDDSAIADFLLTTSRYTDILRKLAKYFN